MGRKIVLVLFSIFIGWASGTLAIAEDASRPSTIEVVGSAKILAKPNMAAISFTVECTLENAEDAVKKNAAHADRLLKSLRKVSGEKAEIMTSGFNLSPVFEKRRRLHPMGYRVSNTVVIKTKDLDSVGSIIDEASRAGAVRIGSLTFGNDQEENLRRDVMIEALRDAMQNAAALAKAAGLTVKRTLNISYTNRRSPRPYSVLAANADRGSTPVEAGQIPIEESVTVVFEVE